MTETGKYGKEIGAPRPRDRRRIDPSPERPTPAARPSVGSRRRRFGYSYVIGTYHPCPVVVWFATATARDQSMRAAGHSRYVHDIKAIDRG